MQEVEKTVDIDTSGPDTEVELNQEDTSDTTAVESTETSSAEPVEPVAEEKTTEAKKATKKEPTQRSINQKKYILRCKIQFFNF